MCCHAMQDDDRQFDDGIPQLALAPLTEIKCDFGSVILLSAFYLNGLLCLLLLILINWKICLSCISLL